MRKVHNKISLKRFFELGGECWIEYHSGKIGERSKVANPKTTEEFNNIMLEATFQSSRFYWNGWEYRPWVKKNDAGRCVFYYLTATEKLKK